MAWDGQSRFVSSSETPAHWDRVAWIRKITKVSLVLKGIQCVEDAVMAYGHGVEGIVPFVPSNHGGRCLDARVPIPIRSHLMPKGLTSDV